MSLPLMALPRIVLLMFLIAISAAHGIGPNVSASGVSTERAMAFDDGWWAVASIIVHGGGVKVAGLCVSGVSVIGRTEASDSRNREYQQRERSKRDPLVHRPLTALASVFQRDRRVCGACAA